MQPEIAVGKYTGNGSTIAINLGFVPDWVHVCQTTDKDRIMEAFRGDTTDTAFNYVSTVTPISANGIKFIDGITNTFGDTALTAGAGFQMNGGNGSLNGKQYKYVAVRSGAGAINLLAN